MAVVMAFVSRSVFRLYAKISVTKNGSVKIWTKRRKTETDTGTRRHVRRLWSSFFPFFRNQMDKMDMIEKMDKMDMMVYA